MASFWERHKPGAKSSYQLRKEQENEIGYIEGSTSGETFAPASTRDRSSPLDIPNSGGPQPVYKEPAGPKPMGDDQPLPAYQEGGPNMPLAYKDPAGPTAMEGGPQGFTNRAELMGNFVDGVSWQKPEYFRTAAEGEQPQGDMFVITDPKTGEPIGLNYGQEQRPFSPREQSNIVYNTEDFERNVFEQIGGNPFRMNTIGETTKIMNKNRTALFNHVFGNNLSYSDIGKMNDEEKSIWEQAQKQYKASIYNQLEGQKAQQKEEYAWMMGKFMAEKKDFEEAKATSYERAMDAKKAPAYIKGIDPKSGDERAMFYDPETRDFTRPGAITKSSKGAFQITEHMHDNAQKTWSKLTAGASNSQDLMAALMASNKEFAGILGDSELPDHDKKELEHARGIMREYSDERGRPMGYYDKKPAAPITDQPKRFTLDSEGRMVPKGADQPKIQPVEDKATKRLQTLDTTPASKRTNKEGK